MKLRSILFGLCLAVWLASPALAQNQPPLKQPAAPGKQQPNCQAMMQARQQHMAQLKASQAELDRLVQQLNQAGPDQQLGALTAVVKQLAQIHQQQQTARTQMQEKMMGHMFQHMHQGGKAGPANCPYFKQMQSTEPDPPPAKQ